tara:strand:+ start:11618 stop:13735 length:2118 start_codon:yes stop_codon:yes gene_type:complete
MNENKKVYSFNYGGKEVTLETGRLAKQTDASVLVTSGGTQVLVTVVSAHEMKDGQDFFPLLVEYTEKFYAAGKFLGGFMKREGRPTTGETLNARLIDRPLRPLFPEGYMFETVVSCTVMSYSPDGDPEVLAGIGASAALSISDIPFAGPIATCKVARIDGKFVLNPSHSEWENSDLEIAVAGSSDAILMVEGEAKIVPEKDVLEAIFWGHDQIKGMVEVIAKMQKEVGKKKREFVSSAANTTLMAKVKADFASDVRASLSIVDKMERQVATKAIMAKVAKAASENPSAFGLSDGDSFKKEAYKAVDGLLYDMMRADILDEEKRIGGRKLNEVRQIETETNILVQPHGSSLFTRGETQVLSSVTIGGSAGEQMADRITGLSYNKFYLHYNFPPYSVGEARGVRGVGRRELGHGNLAERALKPIMPADFPYTTRVVCEVLESNGSSSMGSVCSGSMALMDAGVNIVAPCAGVAMGLISDGKRFKVLTDILGDEDHLGDMDFKVAGPKDGITAIQMDIKITGLTREIVEAAMTQARDGRLHILGEMEKTISTHRAEFKDNVPRVKTTKIETDKIGMLIGPGGKNIKGLQETFKVTIEIAEDGTVKVLGEDAAAINECLSLIDMQINGPKVGSDYEAKVVTIKEYGAFVDIAQGVSGLVHISELADDRVNNVNDYVSEGDTIKVRVVEVDRMGRLKLSAKAAGKIEKKA